MQLNNKYIYLIIHAILTYVQNELNTSILKVQKFSVKIKTLYKTTNIYLFFTLITLHIQIINISLLTIPTRHNCSF